MKRFFKKGNGTIIEVNANHDLQSLKDRFEECDKEGNPMPKKSKKKEK